MIMTKKKTGTEQIVFKKRDQKKKKKTNANHFENSFQLNVF